MTEPSIPADATQIREVFNKGIKGLKQFATYLPPRQRAKFKSDLKKALKECKGNQAAEFRVMQDYVNKANEVLGRLSLDKP
jgi:hypothetical protein